MNKEKTYIPHVLIVDDQFLNRKVLTLILENIGCKVSSIDSGYDLVNNFEEGLYDLILMDIMMPEMDGIETVKNLRVKYSSLPPVVALTADVYEKDIDTFKKVGMDDFLPKPANNENIEMILNKWIDYKSK